MPVVLRIHGLRFLIFVDDHEPAHIHVVGDGEAKIEIGRDGRAPHVVYAVRMSGSVQRRAIRAIADHRAELLRKWVEIHGRSD